MRIRQFTRSAAPAAALLVLSSAFAQAFAQTSAPGPTTVRGISPAATAAQASLSLEEALRRSIDHPDLAIARASMEAALGDIAAADRSPFPVVSVSASSIDLQNGLGPGTWPGKRIDKGVGVDWTWERGDKRRLRTEAARRNAEAVKFEWEEALVQRQLAVATAYWELRAAQDRALDSQALLDSIERLGALTQQRLRKGDVSEQEAGRIQIELSRARSDHSTVINARTLAAQALSRATGMQGAFTFQAGDAWPMVHHLRDHRPDADEQQRIAELRPDVLGARARVEAARAAIDLARSMRVADVTWGSGFNHYPPDQKAMIQLRAQMPLQSGYGFEGEIRRAVAAGQRAEEELRLTRTLAQASMRSLELQIEDAKQRLWAFEHDILPRSQTVLERAESAYAKRAIALTELLEARRTHRGVRLDAIQARQDFARNTAEWQLRLGAAQRLQNLPRTSFADNRSSP